MPVRAAYDGSVHELAVWGHWTNDDQHIGAGSVVCLATHGRGF
ncbi:MULTISPECIES: hypothetical protein [Streptomyces]|nr:MULTISPECIES: hypothetical protein [Streptomyces]